MTGEGENGNKEYSHVARRHMTSWRVDTMQNTQNTPQANAAAGYLDYLRQEERSAATIEKYGRYVRAFLLHLGGAAVTRDAVIAFKEAVAAKYTASGANGMLAAVNSFLDYLGRGELKTRLLRVQRRMFLSPARELLRGDYEKLVRAAKDRGQRRMGLVLQTMFSTGIRVSELCYITVEALAEGRAEINMKGKARVILLQGKLCKKLLAFAKKQGITSGSVFVTRRGNPIDRSNIWKAMKKLSFYARVAGSKVFPHNLRHLFACMYYKANADIAGLASILGHGDINTTRVYVSTSGREQLRRLDALMRTG